MDIRLVGCGRWGNLILRDLLLLGARVHVTDSDVDARRLALELGADSVSEGIAFDPKPDGIIVATPASVHLETIQAVSHFNVPIFVEKPMANGSRAAMDIRDMNGPPIFVMHTWRYHAGVECLARIARERELGQVHMMRSTRVNWTSPRVDVGPVWTLLPHDLSIVMEIFGKIPKPVYAEADLLRGKPVGLMCVLKNELVKVIIEISTRYTDKRRELRLHCEDGIAVLRNEEADWIEILENDRGSEMVEKRYWDRGSGALYNELSVFLNYLRGGGAPKCTAETGVEIVTIVEQILELTEAH